MTLGYRIAAGLVVLALASAGGFWAGAEWQRGREAIVDLRAAGDALEASRRALEDANADHRSTVDAFRQAEQRLGAYSESLAHDREQIRAAFAAHRSDLAALRRSRPDLDGLRVGAGVLQHWNRANGGSAEAGAAGAAAADPARPPGAGVSAAAAGRE